MTPPPSTPAICPVCGGKKFKHIPCLWPELISQWQLQPHEAVYIDQQQGMRCTYCKNNLRSMVLAISIMKCFGFNGTLAQFVKTPEARQLKILEVNYAGQLTDTLSKIPGHQVGHYPQIDMTAMPYADATYDLVIHSDTLEHVPQPVRGLSECRRILKPGRACCFTIPTVVGRLTRSRQGMSPSYHGDPQQPQEDNIVATEYGADAWTHLAQAGFEEVRLFTLLYPAAIAYAGIA